MDETDDEIERELADLRREHDIPDRGAVVHVVLSFVSAAAALWAVWPILTGPLGMVFGLVAHLKGHRLGFPAAVTAGVATVIGMAISLLLFNPFA